jgi:hypothetical protein
VQPLVLATQRAEWLPKLLSWLSSFLKDDSRDVRCVLLSALSQMICREKSHTRGSALPFALHFTPLSSRLLTRRPPTPSTIFSHLTDDVLLPALASLLSLPLCLPQCQGNSSSSHARPGRLHGFTQVSPPHCGVPAHTRWWARFNRGWAHRREHRSSVEQVRFSRSVVQSLIVMGGVALKQGRGRA